MANLAELRRRAAAGEQVDLNGLSADDRVTIQAELRAEQDARVSAEANQSRKSEAAAARAAGKDPDAPRGLPRDADTGRMVKPASVSPTDPNDLARAGIARGQDARAQAARPPGTTTVTSAEQIQGNVREQIRSPIPGEARGPVVGNETYPRPGTASEREPLGLRRSPADNAATETVRAQQARVSSGATAENIERIQGESAASQRNTRIAEGTGQQARPLSGGAGNEPILDPRGEQFEPAREGRALDPEGRAAAGKVDEGVAANTDRQNRANDVIRQNEAAGTPDSREARAAREVIKTTDANLSELEGQRIEQKLGERKAGNRPLAAAVERAKVAASDPIGTADDAVNKVKGSIDAAIEQADGQGKKDLEKVKTIFEKAKAKVGAVTTDLKGRISPSASASAGIDEVTKSIPEGPKKESAVRSLGTLGKAVGWAGVVDMVGQYARSAYEEGTEVANVDLIEGLVQMKDAIQQTYGDVANDEIGMDEVVIELGKGFVDGVAGIIPSILDNGRFFAGEAFDYYGGLDKTGAAVTAPTGLRDQLPAPGSPEFTGPADPGELPGRPDVRFDPTGSQALPEVATDPFLTPGAREGQLNVGLRGGQGNIDVGNAPGGASGFAQRVEESRRSGAYDPVSDERYAEAQRDMGRIKRGTTAVRDLAATRLGVPTQYLDAVRSGAMTPREANLAQAKQAATGNAGGMSAADAQKFQINAQKEGREATEFRQKMGDTARTRFNDTGVEVADTFPNASPEEKAEISSGFTSFAAGWLPEGQDPSQLSPRDLQTVKGQYILATSLAKQGEGWFRSLQPWKSDITANTLFSKGENILQSMERQGEWFDIGNDNLQFRGRDSSGESVTLTVEPEKLPPVAQQMINQARATISPQRGIR
jgi:hypothetical protein